MFASILRWKETEWIVFFNSLMQYLIPTQLVVFFGCGMIELINEQNKNLGMLHDKK